MNTIITDTIEKNTGIAADKQHTMLSVLDSILIVSHVKGVDINDIDITKPSKPLILNGKFIVSVQNDRFIADNGKLERTYLHFYESRPYDSMVSLLDIVTCFEIFIHENNMQDYGNVITSITIKHSPIFYDCKEIAIHFE